MVKGKLILKGIIELLSPAIIGSGMEENSDLDVMKDSAGRPFIPATSFIGVLRHKTENVGIDSSKIEYFWGTKRSDEENSTQSSIACSDLLPIGNVSVSFRDGVRINNKKGIAEDKAKFDYEIIDKGSTFSLNLEITLNGVEDDFKKQMLATIVELLKNEKVRVGAKTSSGFGRMKLKDHKICEFDFSRKQDVVNWFKYRRTDILPESTVFQYSPIKLSENKFTVDAFFTIKNSLIVRSYSVDPNLPDTEHIKSGNDYVLPGTSLKGAIRARAERIINTLEKPMKILDFLFGSAGANVDKPIKGRLIVEETILKDFPSEVQTRIKIDRFTGGTIETALMETKPLFRGKNESLFHVRLTIENPEPHEVGLILLLLKDLWTGDIAVGGEKSIGRGVLEGKTAEIKYNSLNIVIDDPSKLKSEDKKKLQDFVDALVNYGGETC
ncbi:RAMP superfamily CRISPR-associated protein [Thermodesulfovibrio sp. 3907-1M]|uniref:RAMP superfamily CRISPR-associated protein n=1 Tax=Thermodesulfovibrio autotrophicus TaxID=3118333 RepID=A0AAU8GWN5_9BACT